MLLVLLVAGSVEGMEPTYHTYLLPVVTRTTGVAGSFWSTEVCFTNLDWNEEDSPKLVEMFFIKNNTVEYSSFQLPWYETICTTDIVDAVLGRAKWTGTLLIATEQSGWWTSTYGKRNRFLVTAKVTNNTANGTYGLNVSPEIDHFGLHPVHWYDTSGEYDDYVVGWGNGVKNYGKPGVSGYRASIGFVNLATGIDGWDGSAYPIPQKIDFFVKDRKGYNRFYHEETVPPFTQRQIALPSDLDIRKGSVIFCILGEPDVLAPVGSEAVYPYLTVTDNQTGDGVYMPFKVLASSGSNSKRLADDGPQLIEYLRTRATPTAKQLQVEE
jgi:hypothetical protein